MQWVLGYISQLIDSVDPGLAVGPSYAGPHYPAI